MCRRKDRHTLDRNRKARMTAMAETKPTASAAKAFIRKAYECCDVTGYMAKKYDIKGEIGFGEEDAEKA